MLNIRYQENGLNVKFDTEFLHHAYSNVLNKFEYHSSTS